MPRKLMELIPVRDMTASEYAFYMVYSNLDPRTGVVSLDGTAVQEYLRERTENHHGDIVEALIAPHFGGRKLSLEMAQKDFADKIVGAHYSWDEAEKMVAEYTNAAKSVLREVLADIGTSFDQAVSEIFTRLYDGQLGRPEGISKAIEFLEEKHPALWHTKSGKSGDAEFLRLKLIEAVVATTFETSEKVPSIADAKRNFVREIAQDSGVGENVAKQYANAVTDAAQRVLNELYPTTKGRGGR